METSIKIINETKKVYLCKECEKYRLLTRAVGDEQLPKVRRDYCNICGKYTLLELKE